MEIEKKLRLLTKILEESEEINEEHVGNPKFKSWRHKVERSLTRIYGAESLEVKGFNKLPFSYRGLMFGGADYTSDHLRSFRSSMLQTKEHLKSYIEELEEETSVSGNIGPSGVIEQPGINKIFISHSSKDLELVEELIEIIELIGINSSQIFCSSLSGYSIEFGENFLDRIKSELDQSVLVIFLLSANFYQSPICLCEMGATWVKTNKHIPILAPKFEFSLIKGVIPLTQGFKIDDGEALTQFKMQLEKIFKLKDDENYASWERKRDRIMKRMRIKG